MALLDIFNLAAAALPTYNAQAVEHLFQPKFVNKQGTPPRVVWVPTSDRYVAPDPQPPPFTQSGSNILAIEPRCIFTKLASVDVHLWGASYSDCEAFVETYIGALWSGLAAGLWGAFEIDSGHWIATDGREMSLLGMVYVLPIVWRIPIRLPAKGMATITTIPTPTLVVND